MRFLELLRGLANGLRTIQEVGKVARKYYIVRWQQGDCWHEKRFSRDDTAELMLERLREEGLDGSLIRGT